MSSKRKILTLILAVTVALSIITVTGSASSGTTYNLVINAAGSGNVIHNLGTTKAAAYANGGLTVHFNFVGRPADAEDLKLSQTSGGTSWAHTGHTNGEWLYNQNTGVLTTTRQPSGNVLYVRIGSVTHHITFTG